MISPALPTAHKPISSSPLNPYNQSQPPQLQPYASSSSPPQSSPTPFCRALPSPTTAPSFSTRQGRKLISTRYQRPARRTSAGTAGQIGPNAGSAAGVGGGSGDLFSEGTTPTEGAMWRERFTRRMEDREKIRKTKECDLNRRRGIGGRMMGVGVDEDEAERRAQEDDEEIFRRIVILQQKKAHHAALASEEQETGGSDPNLPDFWEEELEAMQREERDLLRQLRGQVPAGMSDVQMGGQWSAPLPGHNREEDLLAREAEEKELEAEEADLARQIEEEQAYVYGYNPQQQMQEGDMEVDMDWDEFDSMDIE